MISFRQPGWRNCKECTACCTSLGVKEIPKQVFIPCQHVCKRGCSIYKDRPLSCQEFYCLWITEPHLVPKTLRPDVSGAVLQFHSDGDRYRIQVNVDPLRPRAWQEGLLWEWLQQMSHALMVTVVMPGKRIIVEQGVITQSWEVDEDEQFSAELREGVPDADGSRGDSVSMP